MSETKADTDELTGEKWALVTGASSGLGIEFARQLAAKGYSLALTARRGEPMEKLAAELEAQHSIKTAVEPLDLSIPGAAETLANKLNVRRISPAVLINNAGFGISSPFLDQKPERLRAMLQLNMVALTELTHLFARQMASGSGGHVLMVASLASLQPTPLLSAYGASKAYVLSLGEALHVELGPKIGVTVLCPGLMETEFFETSGYRMNKSLRSTVLTTAKVAGIGLKALFAEKPEIVAGFLNRLMTLPLPFLSRHQQAKMVFRISSR